MTELDYHALWEQTKEENQRLRAQLIVQGVPLQDLMTLDFEWTMIADPYEHRFSVSVQHDNCVFWGDGQTSQAAVKELVNSIKAYYLNKSLNS